MDTRTTDKDLHWLYDDEAISPTPPVSASSGGHPGEADQVTPPPAEHDLPYADAEIQDGDFTEEIDPDLIGVDGEVVENPPKPKGISIRWLVPIGAGALLIVLTLLMVVLPIFQASASVIITPDRQTINISATLSTQTRQLFTKSLTLSQSVKTTGTAHQNASVGRGLITFYNALPSPQNIPAGTLITGADGMGVVTDADAYIPAGALSVNGQVSVPAHTTATGGQANIQAGDISGACCRDYVFARNSQFTGGADARDYQTPTKTDIQAASQQMSETLQESMTAQAQKQLSSGEAVLPPECTSKTTSSASPGAEAAQITVTLTSTCLALVYNQLDLSRKEEVVYSQAVLNKLGSGYFLDGQLTANITETRGEKGTVEITVHLTGTNKYRFTRTEITNIQRLIAGRSQAQATILLLHTRGVHTVGVQIAGGRNDLPENPEASNIVVFEQ